MPGLNGRFVVNHPFPELASENEFVVSDRAQRLTASGLAGDDVVTIQVWVGPAAGNGDGDWADLFHAGQAVQMDALNTQRIFVMIGTYRAVYAGSADVRVYAQEDTNLLDDNIVYPFNQPYGASGGGSGGGFTLSAGDTDSVDLTYSGTTSSGSLTADVNISADAGNQVSIVADGLFVPDPALDAFNMLHTPEIGDFTVDLTYHGYSIEDGDVVSPTEVTLPAGATASGQIYIVQQQWDASSGGHFGSDVTATAATINEASAPVHLDNGMVALFYATGDSDWNLVNYAQISTSVDNQLEWIPGRADTEDAGLFVPPASTPAVIVIPVTTDTVTLAGEGALNTEIIKPAGTLAALTLDAAAGGMDGAIYFVTFTQIITALTHTSQFDAAGLALATATTAGQVMGYVWRDSASKWTRFQ